MISSTQCGANNLGDIVTIQFTNRSATIADDPLVDPTDQWVFDVSDIVYNVGAMVEPGPVRNLPFAQDATPGGDFVHSGFYFGDNVSETNLTLLQQRLWTNTAFVLPVTLAGEAPAPLVNDGFTQNLGSITLTESDRDGFTTGAPEIYQVCYSDNVGFLGAAGFAPAPAVTATGPVANVLVSTNPVTFQNNCLSFTVTGTAGVDTVIIDGIFGPVVGPGDVTVSLSDVPPAFAASYLTPSDQGDVNDVLSFSVSSDVNAVALPVLTTPVAEAAQLPNRIGGSNRADTAAKIATSMGCQVGVGAGGYAVLVNGNSYPDALSSTYLAGAIGAAVLPRRPDPADERELGPRFDHPGDPSARHS